MAASEIIGLAYTDNPLYDHFHIEEIISFEQLLKKLENYEVYPYLYLDIHSFNYCAKTYKAIKPFVRALVAILGKYKVPSDKVFITSTYTMLLEEVRKLNPTLPLLFEETVHIDRGIRTVLEGKFDGMVIKPHLINKEATRKAHESSIPIITFGGRNYWELSRIIGRNPDVIQTDNVLVLKELLEDIPN